MDTLYEPYLTTGSPEEVDGEISFVQVLIGTLDPTAANYESHKAYYENTIEDLVRRRNNQHSQGDVQNRTFYPDQNGMGGGSRSGGAVVASPEGGAYSSASSYMGSGSALSSPADPTQAFSSRKRSVGSMMGDVETPDAKRPSLNASPAVTPGTPASTDFQDPGFGGQLGSLAFRTLPGTSNFSAHPQRSSTPLYRTHQLPAPRPRAMDQFGGSGQWHPPPTIKPENQAPPSFNHIPQHNFVDLTQNDAIDFAPQDPFAELNQAYRDPSGQFHPSSADAFNQEYMNQEQLAHFLVTPAPGLGGQALNGFNYVPDTSPLLPQVYAQPGQLPGFKQDLYAPVDGQGHPRNTNLERELFGDDVDVIPDANPEAISKLIENIKPDEDVPRELREPTPPAMLSQLMEHQKLGLSWLKKTEESNNAGGILADDMGLGKTVQALALIVARPSNDLTCKTTLVVAPVALMRQWEKEIKRHLRANHQLKVHVYHGSGKKADFNRLRQCDVVLTTFGTLGSEMKQKESRREAEFIIREENDPDYVRPSKDKLALLGRECMWYRVIVDEAQCIKNKATLVSKAASELQARYRLCMTGTPMMNSVEELYPLIRFLRIKPYNDWMKFNVHISKAIKDQRSRKSGMKRLQALLKSIMLRRQKNTIIDGEELCKIPPKHTHQDNVTFSEEEKHVYEGIQGRAQNKFNKYLEKGTVMNNYAYILVLLLRLRQACCHPHLIKDLGIQVATEGIAEDDLKARARQLKQDVVIRLKDMEGGSECPICYDGVLNPTIFLPCGHTCCGECFQKIIDPTQAIREGNEDGGAKCHSCRVPLSRNLITDYKHFCQVFAPEKAAQLFPGENDDEDGSQTDSDSDSDEEDDDGDFDDLDGFVVPDDVDDDFDAPVHGAAASSSAKRESKKAKGKRPAKPKKTLVQLKQESLRNKSAKAKYLKRLRKGYKSSSKIDKTLELISEIRAKDKTEKILIFSQFTSLLDLVEVPLEERGLKYQRYDGSMKMDDRADAVSRFMDEPDQQIMLISLKAGNAGLNLNKASQVILLDPFWNPFVEDQAVDRAHRMPQQREVHVHRVLVPETVEDRIITLQDKKRELINEALDEKAGRSISRLGVGDLLYLFGLGRRPN